MKAEKAKELRQLTREELDHKLKTSREELYKLRFDIKSGQVEKPDRIKTIRRNIARMLTVLKEKKYAEEE